MTEIERAARGCTLKLGELLGKNHSHVHLGDSLFCSVSSVSGLAPNRASDRSSRT